MADLHACGYYSAGFKLNSEANPIAAIWMNGDVLGSHGDNADKRQSGFGTMEMVDLEQRLSHRYAVPSVYLGRPGTYGSAGKHFDMRGRPIEAEFVNAALDGIKQRYHIQTLALGGIVVEVHWLQKCSHDATTFDVR